MKQKEKEEEKIHSTSYITSKYNGGIHFRTRSHFGEPKKEEKEPEKPKEIKIDISKYLRYKRGGVTAQPEKPKEAPKEIKINTSKYLRYKRGGVSTKPEKSKEEPKEIKVDTSKYLR